MRYLVIDASLNGTGIREKYNGGYIDPEELLLNSETINRIKKWLVKYEDEHFNGYQNTKLVDQLDAEGKDIAQVIRGQLYLTKIEYYSDALMRMELLE